MVNSSPFGAGSLYGVLQSIAVGACLALTLTVAPASMAAGGTGKYPLPWPVKTQTLLYHSCGCADACWVAEVKNNQTQRLLAPLRCDCENLYFSVGNQGQEQSDPRACAAPDNKPGFIRDTLQQLLRIQ